MKQHIILGCALLLCISPTTSIGQIVIPHAIPCLTITPSNVLTLPSGISANECIIADGDTVYFKPDQHYSIRAGEYIEFNENTVITPDGSHQFHAYIQKDELDLAWYYPNETPGTVGKFEKLEIGVQFDSTIHNKIERFVNREAGTKLNPFNPEDVDVYAEFWHLVEGSWYRDKRVNGFYYQEFSRDIDTLTWDTVETQHNFRIRYAPPALGTFRCRITAEVFGHDTIIASDFTFEVVPSSNKGFMEVGENYKYFEFGEEPFFPVGHNLLGPEDAEKGASYKPTTVPAYGYVNYHKALRHLKESGANYYRYLVSPWQTEIEFEHLGDYSNRMTNAWEFDNILDTTKALGLKMHFNMAIHFNWDRPNGDGKIYWDWSASGDSLNTPITPWGLDGCFRDIDSGYCYRKDLDLPDPTDFFSDPRAIKHYKNRIRYMEARWGYSTEIAVTEILSEASHVGSSCELVYSGGCGAAEGSIVRPYVSESDYFPVFIMGWHNIMSDYMKDSLKTNHLISVSYAGKPSFLHGDHSYTLSNVDIMSFNNYQIAIDNIEKSREYIKHFQTDYAFEGDFGKEINKPFMHSEYGYGSQFIYKCDNNASFIHRISTGSFTGLASLPLTWDSQFDEQGGWSYYQIINDLMQGIQLDNENWSAQEVMVSVNKVAEVFHLRKEETGENSKIIGAISNRTFNYYTFGDLLDENGDTSKCKIIPDGSELATNPIYQEEQFISGTLDVMTFKNMGTFKGYQIDWISPITGNTWSTEKNTDIFGHLKLELPVPLTGSVENPIMVFKIYRIDATFLSPIVEDDMQNNLPFDFEKDENIETIELTNWVYPSQTELNIKIAPNPTDGIINITVSETDLNSLTWQLIDENGRLLTSEILNSGNFSINLSSYSSGVYYLIVKSSTSQIQTKIVKL